MLSVKINKSRVAIFILLYICFVLVWNYTFYRYYSSSVTDSDDELILMGEVSRGETDSSLLIDFEYQVEMSTANTNAATAVGATAVNRLDEEEVEDEEELIVKVDRETDDEDNFDDDEEITHEPLIEISRFESVLVTQEDEEEEDQESDVVNEPNDQSNISSNQHHHDHNNDHVDNSSAIYNRPIDEDDTLEDDHELAAVQKSNRLSDKEIHSLAHKWFHLEGSEKASALTDEGQIRVVPGRGVHGHNDGDYDEKYKVTTQKSKPDFQYPLTAPSDQLSISKQDSSCLSSVVCRQHSCHINNLYVINGEFHVFLANAATHEMSSSKPGPPKVINIHSSVGHDSENIAIHIHQQGCPSQLEQFEVLEHTASLFSIPYGSNLLGAVSSAVGALFTMTELDVAYSSDNHQVILINYDSSQPQKNYQGTGGSEWREFLHFMAPKTSVRVLSRSSITPTNILVKNSVIGINKNFRIHDFWVESLQGGGKSDTRALAFRSLSKYMRRIVVGESKVDDGFSFDEDDNGEDEGNSNNKVEGGGETTSSLTDSTSTQAPSALLQNVNRPLLCFLSKRGNTRQIINQDSLIEQIKKENLDIMFFNFVGISLDKQIRQIYKCDILVGMHQNLLAHMFFMNPGATIIEIFPYGYRKRTFQNFAQLLELKYMYWQNTAKANSVFNWEYVEQRKTAASTAKEMIVDQPLDWTNADSRLYWKSQNTRVDIPAIVQLVKISSYTKDQERFLMYMPWEQVNNQMIEFKCACAMANILNRTLVLPLMGHRSETSDRDWDFSFRITEFHWLPIEKYLDVSKFSQLPCQIISTENFRSLYATEPDFSLGELHFNPVAKATSEQQLEEYYKTVLGFNFDSIKSHQRLYQLTDKDVINEFSGYKDRVLGMGTLFWIYGFGKTQNYPLEKYENYMHVLLYKKIVGAISVSENLRGVVDVAESYLKQLVPNPIYVNGFGVLKIGYGVAKIAGTVSTAVVGSGGDDDGSLIPSRNGNTLSQVIAQIKQLELSSPNQEFYAIHVRRGDYWNKCKRIQNEVLRNHCYPPADTIYQVVDNAIQIRQKTTSTPSSSSAASSSSSLSSTTKRPTIYIATNIGGDRSEFAGLIAKYRVVFFEDIFMADEKDSFMDSNEMAFLDIELCSRAALFIGNFYSSFSRTIFEMREIKNLDYLTF